MLGAIMLNVADNTFMLSVVMLNVVMLSVVAPESDCHSQTLAYLSGASSMNKTRL